MKHMGTYDQLLPSSGQFISTYAGAPIAETAALGEVITKNFERGMEGISAYNVMRNNVSVLDKDKNLKDEIFDKSYEEIKAYAKRGDYENAIPAIMNATSMVVGNEDLTAARAAAKSVGEFNASVDKLRDVDQWQKDLAKSRMSQYKGIAEGDNISNYMQMPTKSVDIRANMQSAALKVREETIRGEYTWNDQLGKWEREVSTGYNENELDAAMEAALGDPATQAYLAEMEEVGMDTEALINEYKQVVAGAMQTIDTTMEYQTPSKYAKNIPNQGAENVDPATGLPYNYIEITSKNKEALDMTLPGKGIDPDLVEGMEDKIALGNVIEARNKIYYPAWLSALADIDTAVQKYIYDVPGAEEAEEYLRLQEATQTTLNISDEQWADMDKDARQDALVEYAETAGNQKQNLAVKPLTLEGSRQAGFVGTTSSPDQDGMLKGAMQEIERNRGSKEFFSLEDGEIVQLDNKYLKEAFKPDSNYTVSVQGETDFKNPYAKASPKLADSYVMVVTDADGKEHKFLVSKPDGYLDNSNSIMQKNYGVSTTNEDYANAVAGVTSSFSAPNYPGEYAIGDVKINAVRNADKSVSITGLDIGGDEQDLKYLAESYGLKYENGRLTGLTDEMIGQLMLTWNAPKPPKK